ncbi:hypothetical protein [Paenibacillus polymyxa]|uniref:Uncharacterized protein n=1 Tax=Paenibacillus polymyxa (strain SC2) TaxID=886882 RepID=E3EKR5_PAEPS|nr:hypothetical protein [Paenibacillus polymyxa]ADO59516.1 hypothetical protein PPSC2_27515 [Paenibacillus polymyxa SC2]WPQ59652.1 hypothetical protein SKN87_28740 [Paenibacillus polymyxa]
MLKKVLISLHALLAWFLGDGLAHTGVLFHALILTYILKHSIIDEFMVGSLTFQEALSRGGSILGTWFVLFLVIVCLYYLFEYLLSTLEKVEEK